MTQTGKCDTCRERKVKCNEERPKCASCKKKDRLCSYSYGRASAFVVQDPKQLTKHGKSKTAPIIYSLNNSSGKNSLNASSSDSSISSELRITTQREVEDGRGFFQTLAPVSRPKTISSKKKSGHQKRALELYLQHLHAESALGSVRPLSPETTLITRYISMLGPETSEMQPLSILGTWIQSIPSRIGSSRMLDLAVEFLLNSYTTFWNDTHSAQKAARASKAKALKELQLVVINTQTESSYEVLLATKMHYAAEALMGIDTMYHAIHAFGLAEQLKSGAVSNVDDEHFWNLIDNTYIDDVNEAMFAGRKSVYDNEFYLSTTYPPPFDLDTVTLSASQRASIAIMHLFIQCPRLVCHIRYAIANPYDTSALASAMSLMESLIQIDISRHVAGLIQTAISISQTPASSEMRHIMPHYLEFDSVQNSILCTRYWMLQIVLCGMAEVLYRYFPGEATSSLLPTPERLRVIEIDAALNLAKSLPWAQSVSRKLPLVPLRLHTPLQVSIGPWHRMIRYVNTIRSSGQIIDTAMEQELSFEFLRAEEMKDWLIEQCNQIHKQWNVSIVEEKTLLEVLDTMAGEKIPDWLPVRVRFEAEDGEMVIKLDYENRTGSYSERIDINEPPSKRMPNPLEAGQDWQRENLTVEELPLRTDVNGTRNIPTETTFDHARVDYPLQLWQTDMAPVDFIHSTGRNLCSTSGWWPETANTSTILLDSTHKASAFSKLRPSDRMHNPAPPFENADSRPCLASSWWPQVPNALTTRSSPQVTPSNACLSPAWSSTLSVTFDNEKKNGCFSLAWSNSS